MDEAVVCEDRKAGGDAMKRYFLIRHKVAAKETPKQYGLLLVLPGGPGSADFLPFCANVLTLAGTPKDFIVAELVAPVWSSTQAQNNVWPSNAFPSRSAKFTSEQFIDAVIDDVGKQYKIHPGWIFNLGWSSSGHVIYSSSFENKKIRGSFVAMSRFVPKMFAHPEKAKGKRYYFWHSPDDPICPYAESKAAAALLTKYGASTIHKSYKGGHGWIPFTFYGDRIGEAIEWFCARGADAEKVEARITAIPENK
jgi:predicted esterase